MKYTIQVPAVQGKTKAYASASGSQRRSEKALHVSTQTGWQLCAKYDHLRSKIKCWIQFDVNIYPNDNNREFDAKQIKTFFKKALDNHVKGHGFDYAEDSTRVLTIKIKDRKRSRILFSVDSDILSLTTYLTITVYGVHGDFGRERPEEQCFCNGYH